MYQLMTGSSTRYNLMKGFSTMYNLMKKPFYLFISIQPAIHVTSDTSKYNTVQHTVFSH